MKCFSIFVNPFFPSLSLLFSGVCVGQNETITNL
jgi:hypothetical protein